MQQAHLSADEVELCLGPELCGTEYDRATVGNSTIACMRVQQANFARDSVLLTKPDGKYWAGRVFAFLSHQSPG